MVSHIGIPRASEQVFYQLLRDILSGALRSRDPLSERDLVARFGVSRTPAREAVKRLLVMGFLTVGPKGIPVVRDVSREEVEELYALRVEMEKFAAALTVRHISQVEIALLETIARRFEKAVDEQDLTKMLDIKAEFHSVTAKATRNRWLSQILTDLREKAYVVRCTIWQDPGQGRNTIKVHSEMIEALRRRDLQRYRNLHLDHILGPLNSYLSRLLPSALRPARVVSLSGRTKADKLKVRRPIGGISTGDSRPMVRRRRSE
jgi:DNA-binding GntR family transcriptional regulator